MKRCPTCKNTFDDDELSYCTDDGTALLSAELAPDRDAQAGRIPVNPPPTVVMAPPRPTEYAAGPSPMRPPPAQPYGWANEAPPAWTPPPPPAIYRPAVNQQQQTMAIVSLIFGLAGITFGWICGGPVLGLFALILGAVALTQIKRNPAQYGGKPLALVGMITGGLMVLINVAILAIWIVMLIIGAASSR
jgi:Domain of unknown function (DUF4190)